MLKPNFEVGQVWLTENKRRVRILATDVKDPHYPIVGAMESGDEEIIEYFTKDGKYRHTEKDSDYNMAQLAPRRITITAWFNMVLIHRQDGIEEYAHPFDSKEKALSHVYGNNVTILERAVSFSWTGDEPAPGVGE